MRDELQKVAADRAIDRRLQDAVDGRLYKVGSTRKLRWQMTFEELVGALAESSATPIVVTDTNPSGPAMTYVNPAFCALTGYSADELIGHTPRLMQGKATSPLALRSLSKALKAGERFHGYLVNYRKSGEDYLCELDIRPVADEEGRVYRFIAFEREVRRRRGRPGSDPGSRYEAVDKSAVFPE